MHPEKLIGLKEGQLAAECKFLTRLTIQVGFIFVLLTSCVFCFPQAFMAIRYVNAHFTAHTRSKPLTQFSHSLQTQDSVFISECWSRVHGDPASFCTLLTFALFCVLCVQTEFNCCNNDEEGIRESIGFAQSLDSIINNTGPTTLANGDVVHGLFDMPM